MRANMRRNVGRLDARRIKEALSVVHYQETLPGHNSRRELAWNAALGRGLNQAETDVLLRALNVSKGSYAPNKKRSTMKRSRRGKKGNTLMILLGVGAAAGIYLFWSKQAKAAALQASIATTTADASSLAQYNATKEHILAAIQADGSAAAGADADAATQAYLRGNPTELTGIVNGLHEQGATNLAAIFAQRLDSANAAAPAAAGYGYDW